MRRRWGAGSRAASRRPWVGWTVCCVRWGSGSWWWRSTRDEWIGVDAPVEHLADRGHRHLPAHLDQMVLDYRPLHWFLRYRDKPNPMAPDWSYEMRPQDRRARRREAQPGVEPELQDWELAADGDVEPGDGELGEVEPGGGELGDVEPGDVEPGGVELGRSGGVDSHGLGEANPDGISDLRPGGSSAP